MTLLDEIAKEIKAVVILDGLIVDRDHFRAEYKAAKGTSLARLASALGAELVKLGKQNLLLPGYNRNFLPGAGTDELKHFLSMELGVMRCPNFTKELGERSKAGLPIIDPITLRHRSLIQSLTPGQRTALNGRGVSLVDLSQAQRGFMKEAQAIEAYGTITSNAQSLLRIITQMEQNGFNVLPDYELELNYMPGRRIFAEVSKGDPSIKMVWEPSQTWGDLPKLVPGLKIAPALQPRPIYIAGAQYADRYLPQHLADHAGLHYHRLTNTISIPKVPRAPAKGLAGLDAPSVVTYSRGPMRLIGLGGGNTPSSGLLREKPWVNAICARLKPGRYKWADLDALTQGLLQGYLCTAKKYAMQRWLSLSEPRQDFDAPGMRLSLDGDTLSLSQYDRVITRWSGTIARALKDGK